MFTLTRTAGVVASTALSGNSSNGIPNPTVSAQTPIQITIDTGAFGTVLLNANINLMNGASVVNGTISLHPVGNFSVPNGAALFNILLSQSTGANKLLSSADFADGQSISIGFEASGY